MRVVEMRYEIMVLMQKDTRYAMAKVEVEVMQLDPPVMTIA